MNDIIISFDIESLIVVIKIIEQIWNDVILLAINGRKNMMALRKWAATNINVLRQQTSYRKDDKGFSAFIMYILRAPSLEQHSLYSYLLINFRS